MTAGSDPASSSHEDELLSRLYRQVTELQESRFSTGYDLAAGLDRYRTWLREHTEDHAPPSAAEASRAVTSPASPGADYVDRELQVEGSRPTNVTETLVATGAILPA